MFLFCFRGGSGDTAVGVSEAASQLQNLSVSSSSQSEPERQQSRPSKPE